MALTVRAGAGVEILLHARTSAQGTKGNPSPQPPPRSGEGEKKCVWLAPPLLSGEGVGGRGFVQCRKLRAARTVARPREPLLGRVGGAPLTRSNPLSWWVRTPALHILLLMIRRPP